MRKAETAKIDALRRQTETSKKARSAAAKALKDCAPELECVKAPQEPITYLNGCVSEARDACKSGLVILKRVAEEVVESANKIAHTEPDKN